MGKEITMLWKEITELGKMNGSGKEISIALGKIIALEKEITALRRRSLYWGKRSLGWGRRSLCWGRR
ncbi:hypothetical protein LSAT2_012245, partial [Lamellibrachia satsuma]